MRNHQIEKHFPWLSETQEEQLELLLWQRAAQGFESAKLWRNAADCWAQAGDTVRASDLYARSGDRRQAALVLLECGEYAAALKLYQTWGASLLSGDIVGQVEALLGQAACHLLGAEVRAGGLNRASGLAAYHQAHVLAKQSRGTRVWLLLAQYGERVGRYDVVESSCEHGLALARMETERVEVLRVYQRAAEQAGDRIQTRRLTEQLAELGVYDESEAYANWHALRDKIERRGFHEGVRDALHFVSEEQMEDWKKLAVMENEPEVDMYLKSLAPDRMIYIPAGSFLMGSADDDPDADANETPQHELSLRGYYMDKYPLTNGEYRKFIEAGGYGKQEYWTESGWACKEHDQWREPHYWNDINYKDENQPVVGVSWYEAVAYANWAGKGLPSEAEWEKAAGWSPMLKKKCKYPWGNEWDNNKVHYLFQNWPIVGKISPGNLNAYGLADMAGLYIWCSGKIIDYPYQMDDRESIEGTASRVVRGGGSNTKYSRCNFRDNRNHPQDRVSDLGFRCVHPMHSFDS